MFHKVGPRFDLHFLGADRPENVVIVFSSLYSNVRLFMAF